jgi:acetyl esterase/lipase
VLKSLLLLFTIIFLYQLYTIIYHSIKQNLTYLSVMKGHKNPYKKASFYLFAFLTFIITLQSCSKDEAGIGYKELLNQSYGTDTSQIVDVYLPANRSVAATKVVIMLHGGAWYAGSKQDFDPYITTIKQNWPEACIVNANYRLATATTNKHPAQLDDIQLLLNYVNAKQTEWLVSKSYGMMGVSAGAHLAMLYTYTRDVATKQVKALGSIVGPADLTDPYYRTNPLGIQALQNYLGKTWQQDSTLYFNTSPINKITAQTPPIALFYGGQDLLVPSNQYYAMVAKLNQLAIPHENYFYPNEGHVFTDLNTKDAIVKLIAFFKGKL